LILGKQQVKNQKLIARQRFFTIWGVGGSIKAADPQLNLNILRSFANLDPLKFGG
jgi:hypothetical protein